jgi:hypothetical protein
MKLPIATVAELSDFLEQAELRVELRTISDASDDDYATIKQICELLRKLLKKEVVQ